LGERLFARANPWFNTVVFVGPAFVATWWEILFHPLGGLGLQWVRSGGSAHVLSKCRYTIYCIPLVVVDAVEKVLLTVRRPKEVPEAGWKGNRLARHIFFNGVAE
jgi:hypothetical protein